MDAEPLADAEEVFRLLHVTVGMLMQRLGIDQAQAYAMITAASRDTGQTAAEVCSDYSADERFG